MPKQVGIQTWKSLEDSNKWNFYKYRRMSQRIQSGYASLQLKGGGARLALLGDTPPLPTHPLFLQCVCKAEETVAIVIIFVPS